jgi:hypothetical protein
MSGGDNDANMKSHDIRTRVLCSRSEWIMRSLRGAKRMYVGF